jgi:hypothetical protein
MDVYGSVYIHCMEIDLVEANGRLAWDQDVKRARASEQW